MNRTKQTLIVPQEHHHHWRPQVLSTEYVPTADTNMWGRTVYSEFVRCRKQYVCEVCGKAMADFNCICDKEEGERCPPRIACLAETQ